MHAPPSGPCPREPLVWCYTRVQEMELRRERGQASLSYLAQLCARVPWEPGIARILGTPGCRFVQNAARTCTAPEPRKRPREAPLEERR